MARPKISGTVRLLLLVEGASAAFGYLGGVMFFVDPSGKAYGLDVLLERLPVDDFLLVGVWLFLVYGVGFSVVTYAVRNRLPWTWSLAVALSIVWVGWVAVETALWGFHPLIDLWLVPPVLGLGLLAWPGMRSRFRAAPRPSAFG